MSKAPLSRSVPSRDYVGSEGQGRVASLGALTAGMASPPSSRLTLQRPQSQALPSLGPPVFLPVLT